MQHKNFYETPAESNMRLRGTVVMYEGEPFLVLAVTNHKPDGIFRIYLETIGEGAKKLISKNDMAFPTHHLSTEDPALGGELDKFIENNPDSGVLRKYMTSAGFNKFRPFELGMVNDNGTLLYIERGPLRSTPQGLTKNMLRIIRPRLDMDTSIRSPSLDMFGPGFKAMLVGQYPSYRECIDQLTDPAVINDGAAFNRLFAFLRGPIDTLFLSYKGDVIGHVSDDLCLTLDKAAAYTREVCEGLGVFSKIRVKGE